MNCFRNLLLISLMAISGCLVYHVFTIESTALRWEQRVNSAVQLERKNLEIAKAQEYSEQCFKTVRSLSFCNKYYSSQYIKIGKYATSLEEESRITKAALTDSVKRLKVLLDTNSDLRTDKAQLEYKIDCLERALKALPDKGSLKEAILNLLNILMKDSNV